MNKSNWVAVSITLTAIAIIAAFTGYTISQRTFNTSYDRGYKAIQAEFEPQVVTITEYVTDNTSFNRGFSMGVDWGFKSGTDYGWFLHSSPYLFFSDNTTMSLYEAILFTEGNIRSHQYYLDHPELQTSGSGYSAFQIVKIKEYNRLLQFLKRMGDK